jgi:hypothetical protein
MVGRNWEGLKGKAVGRCGVEMDRSFCKLAVGWDLRKEESADHASLDFSVEIQTTQVGVRA